MIRTTNLSIPLVTAVFLSALVNTAFAGVIYVDADAPGSNNGSSWENAYTILQDALHFASSGDEIRAAEGTYRADQGAYQTPLSRTATFTLINGVEIKGGYAGYSQPDPNARDIDIYESILSGDLQGNDVYKTDPVDLIGDPNRADNTYHIVTGSNRNATAVIDGFTIVGGNANGANPYHRSGGMYMTASNATVKNCSFFDNTAQYGGALYNFDSFSSLITNCLFEHNAAIQRGGGMYNSQSTPTITNCVFSGNRAGYADDDNSGGGGMLIRTCNPTITNCLFYNNDARFGGAIHSIREGNPLITNCTFVGNYAITGGGLCIDKTLVPSEPAEATVKNCVFWNNSDDGGSGQTAQIYGTGGILTSVNYSCIMGWTAGGIGGTGNFDADPCFVNTSTGSEDFHLKSQAGCWNSDTQSWLTYSVTSPAIDMCDPADPVGPEPFPNGGRVNAGAYGGTAEASKSYFGGPVCETIVAGDINGDCKIDLFDFAFMALHWLEDNNP